MKLPDTIVMASGNAGKIKEIATLLADLDVNIVPQSDYGVSDADETGSTFEENAIIKARHAAAATGLAAIADDSGLAVDALDGRPGVYSARYAGIGATDEQNIDKLLEELEGVADEQREAAFHCVACFVFSADAEPLLAKGSWRGHILDARRGSGGFGYDPVFIPEGHCETFGQLPATVKNALSHRARALEKIKAVLPGFL